MNFLALDLGTRTGFCLVQGASQVHGFKDFKNGRYEGGGMRYLAFRRWLDELRASTPIAEVVFEEVRRHLGTDAAHVYGGLLGVLTAWCEEHKIPYVGVPVGTIKKHMTGKGNAPKGVMVACVQEAGYVGVSDDNEADAIALALYHLGQTAGQTAAD